MKRKKITLAAGIIILALLLLFYFILHNSNKEKSGVSETENVTAAFSADKEDMKEVTFQSKKGTFKFVKEEDTWKYESDKSFPLNQTSFTAILDKLTKVDSSRVLENTEDISKFGLDNPSVNITIKSNENTEQTLEFGDINEITSTGYMSVNKDTTKIFMVDSQLAGGFEFNINDLAEKEEFPSITGSTVTNLTITKENQSLVITKDESSTTGWTFTNWNGIKKDAGSSQVSTYFNQLSGLSWFGYVNQNNGDLTAYGLDNPIKITINYQESEAAATDTSKTDTSEDETAENTSKMVDKQEVLLIGKVDAEGNYYAKLESQQNIYSIAADTIDSFLNVEANTFLDSYVSNYSFTDLDKVVFTKNDNSYTFTKKTEEIKSDTEDAKKSTTETKYYLNDKEVTSDNFLSFYSKISGMECQSRMDEVLTETGNPEISMQFYKENGINVTVDYYSYDTNFYLVKDNKGNISLVNKMKVKEMSEAFDTLLRTIE